MFVLCVQKNRINVRQLETLTSGSVNVYSVRFELSGDWGGLERTAVFYAGQEKRSVLLDDTNTAVIPWEALQKPGLKLYAGVYGTRYGEIVLPTLWADLGTIREGTATGGEARPPTPDLWEQELARKGDALKYDGLRLSLMSGEKRLSSVEISGGGGEGTVYQFGHGLKQDGLNVSVDMSSRDNPDKTLPISAAAVECTVGNIEILLQTI